MFVTGAVNLGERFLADLGKPRAAQQWRPALEIFGTGLTAALNAVATRRGADRTATAGALMFEQYCGRLIPPVLAAAIRDELAAVASLDAVHVRFSDGAVHGIALERPPVRRAESAARAAISALVDDNLAPAADVVRHATRIGARTLNGSMANAVANTLLHLSWTGGEEARRGVEAARTLLGLIPGGAPLVNVRTVDVEGRAWMYTDRNTCCLAFRTSTNRARSQRFCATCPATPRETTELMFREAVSSFIARGSRPRNAQGLPRRSRTSTPTDKLLTAKLGSDQPDTSSVGE